MKTIIAITLMLCSITVIAQTKKEPVNPSPAEPVFMIDSVKTAKAYFEYLDSNDIASFNVFKNQQYPDGVVYATLKDHNMALKLLRSPLLSLNDIAKANVPQAERSKPVLFMVDDKLLTDTAGVRIPSFFVYHVKVTKATETAYFKTALPDVLLMMISTKPSVAYIRGIAANN
jgi:hypothetical protein